MLIEVTLPSSDDSSHGVQTTPSPSSVSSSSTDLTSATSSSITSTLVYPETSPSLWTRIENWWHECIVQPWSNMMDRFREWCMQIWPWNYNPSNSDLEKELGNFQFVEATGETWPGPEFQGDFDVDMRDGGGRVREFIYDWSDASNKHLRYKTGRINPSWHTEYHVSDNAFSDNTKNILKQHDALKPENIPLPDSVPSSLDGTLLSTSPKLGSSGTGDSSGGLKQEGESDSDASTVKPIHIAPVSETSTITPILVSWSESLSPDTSSFVTAPDTPATGSLIDAPSGLMSAAKPFPLQLEVLKINDFATSKVADVESPTIEVPIGEIVTNLLSKDELDNREIAHGIKERDLERDWIWTWLKASENKLQHENQKRSLPVEDSISGAWFSSANPYLKSQSAAVFLCSLGLVALVLAIWGMWLQRRRRNRSWHAVSSV